MKEKILILLGKKNSRPTKHKYGKLEVTHFAVKQHCSINLNIKQSLYNIVPAFKRPNKMLLEREPSVIVKPDCSFR